MVIEGGFNLEELRVGDGLLYQGHNPFSWATRIKTFSEFSHVEVVSKVTPNGTGPSRIEVFTSLFGFGKDKGVGFYDLDPRALVAVLRPRTRFDLAGAYRWGQSVDEQGYDHVGLFAFWFARLRGKENGKMFCSEACVRYMRHGGVDVVATRADADNTPPGHFWISPALELVWVHPKLI